jgi:pseudouridine-5'-phosphate glycosidase
MKLQDLPECVDVHPTVAGALRNGQPVVALESTIITHGMPFPDNIEMSQSVEKIISENGAVPALIAIIDGRIKVGLTDDERALLGSAKNARKVSRADLAFAVSNKENAGTTVAATMMIAEITGIRVFATGGIGGVHKGASDSFDVSADLMELGRTNVIVVAAGAKAILDVPKTMEVLETQGVPVIGFQTDSMPAFWSRESDIDIPLRVDTASEIAAFLAARDALGIEGGILVANPIPHKDEIPQHIMQSYIETAQSDLDRLKIKGKSVTPYLLSRIFELSNGDSLRANIALVENNASVATEIAKSLQ